MMKWGVLKARNGDYTLLLNDVAIYSKYNPKSNIDKFIEGEIEQGCDEYLLIGLGLGYHLEALNTQITNAKIYVYYFSEEEFAIYKEYGVKLKESSNEIQFIKSDLPYSPNLRIVIPDIWVKAIGAKHPLFLFLEDIKIKQLSYKKFSEIMHSNFQENIVEQFCVQYPCYQQKIACLVSAGPSLNETINWLQNINRNKVTIFCVGSAYQKLLAANIVPDALVISDPQPFVINQIGDNHLPHLYYLSTVHPSVSKCYNGQKYIVFQQGYPEAENLANKLNCPTIEVGGSVATVTFSLIELLGFKQLVLFGQDLGFSENLTHANGVSTYNRDTSNDKQLYEIESNIGTSIKTTKNLMTYLRWFNQKVPRSAMKVYNTAQNGAKITGAPLIDEQQFNLLLNKPM